MMTIYPLSYDFNPHSHAGSDMHFTKYYMTVLISIHTPTQGVTAKDNLVNI